MSDGAEAGVSLTREQFRNRFIAYFVEKLGLEVRGCAEEAWESYWENPDLREYGPEICAAEEVDEWYE